MDIFEKVCRSCNNERKNMLNIYQSKLLSNSTHVEEMLRRCTQTSVTIDDEYPKQICYICAKQLEIAYKFLKQFSRSKTHFDKIINYRNRQHSDEQYESLMIHDLPKLEDKPKNMDILIEQGHLKPNLDSLQLEQLKDLKKPTLVDDSTVWTAKAHRAERIACTQCSKTFFTEAALLMHQKISHKIKSPAEGTQ